MVTVILLVIMFYWLTISIIIKENTNVQPRISIQRSYWCRVEIKEISNKPSWTFPFLFVFFFQGHLRLSGKITWKGLVIFQYINLLKSNIRVKIFCVDFKVNVLLKHFTLSKPGLKISILCTILSLQTVPCSVCRCLAL